MLSHQALHNLVTYRSNLWASGIAATIGIHLHAELIRQQHGQQPFHQIATARCAIATTPNDHLRHDIDTSLLNRFSEAIHHILRDLELRP